MELVCWSSGNLPSFGPSVKLSLLNVATPGAVFFPIDGNVFIREFCFRKAALGREFR